MTLPFKIAFDADLERPVVTGIHPNLVHDAALGIPLPGDVVILTLGVETRNFYVRRRDYDYSQHPPTLTLILTDSVS